MRHGDVGPGGSNATLPGMRPSEAVEPSSEVFEEQLHAEAHAEHGLLQAAHAFHETLGLQALHAFLRRAHARQDRRARPSG